VETAVEIRAAESYKQQGEITPTTRNETQKTTKAATASTRVPAPRSPRSTKALEPTFGVKNLPSDEIGKVVSNTWMIEAANQTLARKEEIARLKAIKPKKLQGGK